MIALLVLLAASAESKAAFTGFNLNLMATSSNAGFGTGVTAGDIFLGTIFVDSVDLTPDGSRARSVLSGDTLTIAGISYDALLNDTSWAFTFAGSAPLCIGDAGLNGCGQGEGQGIGLLDGRALQFTDAGTGGAAAPTAEGGQFIDFSYTLTAIPEPGTLGLIGVGLLGMGLAMRRRRPNPD